MLAGAEDGAGEKAQAAQCALCQQKLSKWVACPCGARMHVECLAQDWLKVRFDSSVLLLAGSRVSPSQWRCPCWGSSCCAPVLGQGTVCLRQPHELGTLGRPHVSYQVQVCACSQTPLSQNCPPAAGVPAVAGRAAGWTCWPVVMQ